MKDYILAFFCIVPYLTLPNISHLSFPFSYKDPKIIYSVNMRKGPSLKLIEESFFLYLLFKILVFVSKYLQLDQVGSWPLSTCLLLPNPCPLLITFKNASPFLPQR